MGWDGRAWAPSIIHHRTLYTYARGGGAVGVQDLGDEAQGREAAGGLGGLALGAGALLVGVGLGVVDRG